MGLTVAVTEAQGSWGCCSSGRCHQEVGSFHPQGWQGSVGHGCSPGDTGVMGTKGPRGHLMNAIVESVKTSPKSQPSNQQPGKCWDFV